jgi:hypothetical protein
MKAQISLITIWIDDIVRMKSFYKHKSTDKGRASVADSAVSYMRKRQLKDKADYACDSIGIY